MGKKIKTFNHYYKGEGFIEKWKHSFIKKEKEMKALNLYNKKLVPDILNFAFIVLVAI